MLNRLSIRDIVLIDRLDIDFASGLSVLTGETGAGKSILLDAFALALGARGDVALVRQGAEQGQVTAAFDLPSIHPARALLAQNDIPAGDELILRRLQFADGRTRAFVNDQPVSAQVMKGLGAALVEIHGQHDERALVDAATHRALLDAFGGLEGEMQTVATLWQERRARAAELAVHHAEVASAQRDADWLRHAVEELGRLAPAPTEEIALAEPTNADCLRCHTAADGKPVSLKTINPFQHYKPVCLECHDPHTSDAVRPPIVRHPLDDLPPCVTCHDPEGFKARNQRHPDATTNDAACLECHAPNRGPARDDD